MVATEFIDRLLAVWTNPPADDQAARAAFLALYTETVRINGAETPVDGIVLRARGMCAAFSELRTEVLSHVEGAGRLAIAFRLRGKHTGTLPTPLGEIAPTGAEFVLQINDVLTLVDGRIREVWMVADMFGQLLQLDALRLKA